MFGLFEKKMFYTTKLIAVVDYESTCNFKTIDILDVCTSYVQDEISHVRWNYGREWNKYGSFKKFHEKTTKETVDLALYANTIY